MPPIGDIAIDESFTPDTDGFPEVGRSVSQVRSLLDMVLGLQQVWWLTITFKHHIVQCFDRYHELVISPQSPKALK
jgi:hypothetical protein